MRGRRPKPTVLKILAGNPGKRKVSGDEPRPEKAAKGARRCPAWMPPQGKRLWKSLVPELEKLNLLSKIDDATLEGACANYARALQAEALVKKQGLVIVTDKGFTIQHPAVSIAKNAWASWLRFATEFGLTPSARSRINIKPSAPSERDADEDFLFGGAKAGGASA
jgi:P27 family predicted phage terminase small subunit